jgi:hypothetical protein
MVECADAVAEFRSSPWIGSPAGSGEPGAPARVGAPLRPTQADEYSGRGTACTGAPTSSGSAGCRPTSRTGWPPPKPLAPPSTRRPIAVSRRPRPNPPQAANPPRPTPRRASRPGRTRRARRPGRAGSPVVMLSRASPLASPLAHQARAGPCRRRRRRRRRRHHRERLQARRCALAAAGFRRPGHAVRG